MRGFSLIELLISAAIITVITSIILVRFTSFDSSVLLKGLAYDIASSIRDAQVYAVSVVRTDNTNSHYPYGMAFNPGTTYSFFRYNDATLGAIPSHSAGGLLVTDINVLTIGRTMQIADLCVTENGGQTCGLNELDISFRRPEFRALFNGKKGGTTYTTTVESATIVLNSSANTSLRWDVTVSLLGQISVKKEP